MAESEQVEKFLEPPPIIPTLEPVQELIMNIIKMTMIIMMIMILVMMMMTMTMLFFLTML